MLKLSELARAIGADVFIPGHVTPADADPIIARIAPIMGAQAGDITFLSNAAFVEHMMTTKATAIIVAQRHPECAKLQLVHPNPYLAYAKTAQLFYKPETYPAGVSPEAHVAPEATVHPTATVLPYAYVAKGARIGARTVLHPGVYVGPHALVGDDVELRAHVVVEAHVKVGSRVLVHAGTVIGADGFGFAPSPTGLEKIPQSGSVVIGNDVEVGALCTIDRGALEDTVVGNGSKLDSHVHVGHGVTVGQHSVLCAFVGIAGSAEIGNGVVLGGHTGVSNKVKIADGVQVGAMSGVTKDLTEKGIYMGFPAGPAGEWRRQIAGARRQGDLEKRVRELEKKLAVLLDAGAKMASPEM